MLSDIVQNLPECIFVSPKFCITRMNVNSFQDREYVDLDQGRIGERVRNWDLVGIWRIGSFMKG